MVLQELFRDSEGVTTLPPRARMSDAAELMRREKIGCVVIVEDDVVIGLITDRDIALSVTLGAATPDSFVSEAMSREVETVFDTMTLFDVTRYFRAAGLKRLPVVDSQKKLVGIVSTDDVIAFLARQMFDTCSTLVPKLGHPV